MKVRLQKIMADFGIASRRGAEEKIKAGEVTINGKTAKIGDKAIPGVDHIKVDGKLLQTKPSRAVYALYKPYGVVCQLSESAKNAEGSIYEYMGGMPGNVIPVPKLDKDAEGLVLLTNDGELIERLNRGKFEVPKTFEVKIDGSLDETRKKRLLFGVEVEGKRSRVKELKTMRTTEGKQWVELITTDPQNRQIRKIFESVGRPVDKVRRTQIADIKLSGLSRGRYRKLREDEVKKLYAFVGLTWTE
jgi:23S rRNA pseudouridine2605 synthase